MRPTVTAVFMVMLAAALTLGAPAWATSADDGQGSDQALLAAPAPLSVMMAEVKEQPSAVGPSGNASGTHARDRAAVLDAGPLLIAAAPPSSAAGTAPAAITATALPATAAGPVPDPPAACPPAGMHRSELALYAWLTSIHATVGVRGLEASVDKSFSELRNLIKGGAMLHYESAGPTSFLLDVVYAKLGKTIERPLTTVDFDVKEWLVEAGVLFGRKGDARGYGEWLAGGRFVRFTNSLSLTPPDVSASASKSWAEPFVGGRYGMALSDRWWARVTGNVGGFGVGSKFTWEVAAVFGYQITATTALGLGYRYLNIDYNKSGFEFDGSLAGPIIGVGFAI